MNVVAVILATDGWRGERGRQSQCIIQRGWEIRSHLCPYPCGPVRIDPQPLTFSDTRSAFHSLRCVRTCVGVCMSASACCSLTFPLDYSVRAGYMRKLVIVFILLSLTSKVNLEYGKHWYWMLNLDMLWISLKEYKEPKTHSVLLCVCVGL